MENNGENSGPLMSLPVDRLMATDCNAAARGISILPANPFIPSAAIHRPPYLGILLLGVSVSTLSKHCNSVSLTLFAPIACISGPPALALQYKVSFYQEPPPFGRYPNYDL